MEILVINHFDKEEDPNCTGDYCAVSLILNGGLNV